MTTVARIGRVGNNIIRNLAVSLIAQKYDLKVDYYNKDLTEKLGIKLFSGTKTYIGTIELTDENYFSIYENDKLENNLNPNAFFQTKEITNLLYNYLHEDIIKTSIIEKNVFKKRYNNNNDLFIHIRLGDVSHFNPGINYYVKAINNISFDKLYISTDDKNNNIIKKLLELYPKATIVDYDEITTFQFASTCKNIILSHGSFSAIIGYLAFFSNVYYPKYESNKIWYGDIFSINNWIKIDFE